ncbi:MAG: glycoside hydrolase family 3 C-terminal domain-containing protein, partial [Cyclobacteriaceae bacterium]|nr:glycoside hydrolase family 3 C-terminal domain-containing protein [Cyclobacteriaceae bacterium]
LTIECNRVETPTDYKFLDTGLRFEERVDDRISQLTLEEKIGQLNYDAPAIERLGIPPYNWWNECLHGVGRAGMATVFPQAIGMAATWNQDLMLEIGCVISDEARAKHHDFARSGKRNIYYGLTFWTPNINIFRDPRWGRGQETYGEDPYLTAGMAVPFIRGLQGDDEKYLKLVATAKHFAVHSGPEHSRHSINLEVSHVDLYETYLPAFEATIREADVASVMCAYNRVRGEACCGSNLLLNSILRNEWDFQGYVVSDCGALSDFYRKNTHEIVTSPEEAAALAFSTGTDLNCGSTSQYLLQAVEQGLISEENIDVSLKRLFLARFRLGMFDPEEDNIYASIPIGEVRSQENLEKSLQASRESIVLLKNEGILPLTKGMEQVAVVGPLADDYRVLLGNYHGTSDKLITPLSGIKSLLNGSETRVSYAPGCQITTGIPNLVPIQSQYLLSEDSTTDGLSARYYGNRDFSGPPAFERIDDNVNFWWYDQSPVSGESADEFSVIWEGYIEAPYTDQYAIGMNACNGVNLYFQDSLRIRFDNVHHPLQQTFVVNLKKGEKYPVKIEFYNYGNDPQAHLLWGRPGEILEEEAVALVNKSDVAILFLGLSPYLEGEEMPVSVEGFSGGDRTDIKLPSTQLNLMNKVLETGKPVVLVLMGGSAIAVNEADQHVPGILHAWYPGESGGKAIAEVLFGEVNPSAKLPVTFYRSVEDLPDFEDYRMQDRTYKYFQGEVLYPFGHGLSYTRFEFSDLSVEPSELLTAGNLTVSVKIKNEGDSYGAEVVQLFLKDQNASFPVPDLSLEGFQKVFLAPGEEKNVRFTITPDQLAIINERGERVLEPGSFQVYVGGKQPGMTGNADNPNTGIMEAEIEYVGPFETIE